LQGAIDGSRSPCDVGPTGVLRCGRLDYGIDLLSLCLPCRKLLTTTGNVGDDHGAQIELHTVSSPGRLRDDGEIWWRSWFKCCALAGHRRVHAGLALRDHGQAGQQHSGRILRLSVLGGRSYGSATAAGGKSLVLWRF
jgi:hypothetical protein